jgi:hypothetical protein
MMDVCALFRALPPTYKIILEFSMVSAMFFGGELLEWQLLAICYLHWLAASLDIPTTPAIHNMGPNNEFRTWFVAPISAE